MIASVAAIPFTPANTRRLDTEDEGPLPSPGGPGPEWVPRPSDESEGRAALDQDRRSAAWLAPMPGDGWL